MSQVDSFLSFSLSFFLSLPLSPLRLYLKQFQFKATQVSSPSTTYEFWLTPAVSDSMCVCVCVCVCARVCFITVDPAQL